MIEAYKGDRDYLFVSYSYANRDVALPIIDMLMRTGYRVWYDDRIEPGSEYPQYIADHVDACRCMLVLMSQASAKSRYCWREVHRACTKDKDMLVVYLEEVQLDSGQEMELDLSQAMHRNRYESDGDFHAAILKARILDSCMSDEALRRREVIGSATAAISSYLEIGGEGRLRDALAKLHSLPGAGQDEVIVQCIDQVEDCLRWLKNDKERREQVEHMRQAEEDRRADKVGDTASMPEVGDEGPDTQPNGKALIIAIVAIAVVALLVVALFASGIVGGSDSGAGEGVDNGVWGAAFTKGLSDYDWQELKSIADEIAAAGSDAEGLEIAKSYGLVANDGGLNGTTKPVTFTDGTQATVRIAGFRHDDRSDGGGKAGITFEFADVPAKCAMNPDVTNAGGWEASQLREWLNSDFVALLPDELRSGIVVVEKMTNNVGEVGSRNDTSVVTATSDALWLLSTTEVYGSLSDQTEHVPMSPATYEAEGTQYQLYADQGVTISSYDFCEKSGVESYWWLRSPDAGFSFSFRNTNGDGAWSYSYASSAWGVSPGFCF